MMRFLKMFLFALLLLVPGMWGTAGAEPGTGPVSAIASPSEGGILLLGPLEISGTASSPNGVAFVSVSTDGGATWETASGKESWTFAWTPPGSGAYTLISRAIDAVGLQEPAGTGISVKIIDDLPLCLQAADEPTVVTAAAPDYTQSLYAWGYNGYGQLGDGTYSSKYTPAKLTGFAGIAGVDGGSLHSVAVKNDGTVWAWGYNWYGQLGDGTTTQRNAPVQVSVVSGVKGVSAGNYHSVAVKNDGTVWAWGYNGNGQLGDGTTTQRNAPVQVAGLGEVTAVAAGASHTVALKSDGSVWAWGDNWYGQLGDGTTTQRIAPVQVGGLTGVIAVSAGGNHTVALKSDGTVWAWGYNGYGQLGDGTTTQRTAPVQVSGLAGIIAVAAGANHSVALKNDGSVWAWGYNGNGQLGDGTTTQRTAPVAVKGMCGASAIAAGYNHSLTVRGDGTAWAWGYNGYGQLGDGTGTTRYIPVQVSGLAKAAMVMAGENHTIAVRQTVTSVITSPTAGAVLTGTTATISGNADDGKGSGVRKVEVSTDNGATWEAASGTSSWSYSWKLPVNGTYQLRSRATDNAGNVEIPGAGISVAVNNTRPATTINAPAAGAALTGVSAVISGTVTPGALTVQKVEVSTDNGATWVAATGTTSWSYTWKLPVNGSYTIKVRATDLVGNQESPAIARTVTVSNTLPSATITAPASWAVLTGASTIVKGTATAGTAPLQKIEVSTDGGTTWKDAAGTTSWSYTWQLPVNGSYAIYVRATDAPGNVAVSPACIPVIVNNTPPASTITAPSGGAVIVGTDQVKGTAVAGSSTLDRVEVSTNGGSTWSVATGTTSWTFSLPSLANGTYTIRSRAVDVNGNVENPGPSITVTVANPVYQNAEVRVGSATVPIGTVATVPIQLVNPGKSPVAAVSCTITFDPSRLTKPAVKAGPAATAAGKAVSFNSPEAGKLIIAVSGLNQNVLGEGDLALVSFTAAPVLPVGTVSLTNGAAASAPSAAYIPVTSTSGSVSIFLPGDVSGNGVVIITEVQSAINMYLKKSSPSPRVDTNGDKAVSTGEVQAAINSHLLRLPTVAAVARTAAVLAPLGNNPMTSGKPKIAVGSAVGKTGGSVTVPITLSRVKGLNVAAASSIIGYDPAVFDTPTVSAGPAALSAGKEVISGSPNPGELIVGIFGINDQTVGNGIVAYVTFPIRSGASPGRTVLVNKAEVAALDAQMPQVSGKNGVVTIRRSR